MIEFWHLQDDLGDTYYRVHLDTEKVDHWLSGPKQWDESFLTVEDLMSIGAGQFTDVFEQVLEEDVR